MSVRATLLAAVSAASLSVHGLLASDPQTGFPLATTSGPFNKLLVADLSGNGLPDIVVSRGGNIVAVDGQGNVLPGWPFVLPTSPQEIGGAYLPPLVGDIDGDGELDVVFEGRRSTDKTVYAVTCDGQLKPGWPVEVDAPGSAVRQLCLGDIDNDGDLEILVGDGSQLHGILFVYGGDGQYHPGFPRVFEELSPIYGIVGVAVGDLEFDGTNEIVVSFSGYQGTWVPGPVFVLNGDGTTRPGWPAFPPGLGGPEIAANPAIADLDGDLTSEIVGNFAHVFVMNRDGTAFAGSYFADASPNVPLAIADVDSDGSLEVVSAGFEITVWKLGVGIMAQTSSTDEYAFYMAVAVADFNGDGLAEIAAWSTNVAGNLEQIHLLDLSMNELPGWPKVFPSWSQFPPRTLAIADLDGDNDLEVIVGHQGNLHAWDVENPGPGVPRVEWGMIGHDAHKAGFYHTGNLPRRHYLRGDANRSGLVDMADAMAILEYLYSGETSPCAAQNDFDVDGAVSMTDAVCLLQYLFFMGSPPGQPPFPECDAAPLGEDLPCRTSFCP
ncbi:MAG: FG-GAP-like repeat-containing protein [Planctomycetota bacterium]